MKITEILTRDVYKLKGGWEVHEPEPQRCAYFIHTRNPLMGKKNLFTVLIKTTWEKKHLVKIRGRKMYLLGKIRKHAFGMSDIKRDIFREDLPSPLAFEMTLVLPVIILKKKLISDRQFRSQPLRLCGFNMPLKH